MNEEGESKKEISLERKKDTSLAKADYHRDRLFKKGVIYMADEKLEEASETFEMILRTNPNDVDAMLKLGYSRFHLEDYSEAMRVYGKVLDIDITNTEAWNLKSLVNYEKKNYAKALDCVEKALDSDPTYGMAWYNKSCYLSLLNQVSESMDALKRSIEIDVKNARRAVKDKDFVNVRAEAGFKNIIQVVIIESLRQGYHTIGAIVWTTFLSKEDALKSLNNLIIKGLVMKSQKRQGFNQNIDIYDLIPEMTKKLGQKKHSLLGSKLVGGITVPIKNLKEIGLAVQTAKSAVEQKDMSMIIESFETFIDPTKCGEQMIEEFLEEHREIRLYKIRLQENGNGFLTDNKSKMLEFFENLEIKVTKKLRTSIPQS